MEPVIITPDLLSKEIRCPENIETLKRASVLIANVVGELSLVVPEEQFRDIRDKYSDILACLGSEIVPLVTPEQDNKVPEADKKVPEVDETPVPKITETSKPEPTPDEGLTSNALDDLDSFVLGLSPEAAEAARALMSPAPDPIKELDDKAQAVAEAKGIDKNDVPLSDVLDPTPKAEVLINERYTLDRSITISLAKNKNWAKLNSLSPADVSFCLTDLQAAAGVSKFDDGYALALAAVHTWALGGN